MNKNSYKNDAGKDKWVCCPECGSKNRKSAVGSEICICKNCSTHFRAWVVKGFVTVFPIKENEDENTAFIRFKEYHEKLMLLTE